MEIIKMYFEEMGWEGVDWSDLAPGRDKMRDFVKMVMNLQFP
jgi:hypothetical protein